MYKHSAGGRKEILPSFTLPVLLLTDPVYISMCPPHTFLSPTRVLYGAALPTYPAEPLGTGKEKFFSH